MLYQIDPIAWMMAGEHRHLLLNEPSEPRLPYHLRPVRGGGPSLVSRAIARVRATLDATQVRRGVADVACCAS